ncbi:hypothetical protein E1I18_02910 [Mycoplasmopsis mucosicanis]|uniref:DUF31 domain-containing protein n=1 Tax=Mycoplasmopsis mucosicanis TaxID=458208 RepID=A0A507SI35_9BACT|nr:hypothetical protein [Mycoplasmopsis mucosicanis]TQC51370.1 hypothetical protein E1I18_02910 [Mycoplasmopsis mucosicanis]
MKKRKIFIITGSSILLATAVFATAFTTLKYKPESARPISIDQVAKPIESQPTPNSFDVSIQNDEQTSAQNESDDSSSISIDDLFQIDENETADLTRNNIDQDNSLVIDKDSDEAKFKTIELPSEFDKPIGKDRDGFSIPSDKNDELISENTQNTVVNVVSLIDEKMSIKDKIFSSTPYNTLDIFSSKEDKISHNITTNQDIIIKSNQNFEIYTQATHKVLASLEDLLNTTKIDNLKDASEIKERFKRELVNLINQRRSANLTRLANKEEIELFFNEFTQLINTDVKNVIDWVNKLSVADLSSNLNKVLTTNFDKTNLHNLLNEFVEYYNQQKQITISRVKDRLSHLSATNNKENEMTWAEGQYYVEFKDKLQNSTDISLDLVEELEKDFIFGRYYDSRRLHTSLDTLEFMIKLINENREKQKKSKLDSWKYERLINDFRFHGKANRVNVAFWHKFNKNYETYSDKDKNSRTLDDFALLWSQINSKSNSEMQQIFNAGLQWDSVPYSNVASLKFGDFKHNNQNNVIDKALNLAKQYQGWSNIEEMYNAVDQITSVGLGDFVKDKTRSTSGYYSFINTYSYLYRHNKFIKQAFDQGAKAYETLGNKTITLKDIQK